MPRDDWFALFALFAASALGIFPNLASAQSIAETMPGAWSLNRPGAVAETASDHSSAVPNRQSTPEPFRASPKQQPSSPQATSANVPETLSRSDPFIDGVARQADSLGATRISGSLVQTALLLGALGLAPAVLLMTTCYVRLIVVLGLLRQALGTSQLPPTQILMSLSMFLTLVVMAPTWLEIKQVAWDPYFSEPAAITWQEAWQRGSLPLKKFMVRQIEISGNRSALDVMYRHSRSLSEKTTNSRTEDSANELPGAGPTNALDVPLNVLLPAFVLSELKVAFLLGFQIFLPFLILDLVVSTVTVSMGLAMLPPATVSLPLKLILFVMVDGWNLVVGMLLQSFG